MGNKFLDIGKTFWIKDIKTNKSKKFVAVEQKQGLPSCNGCWFYLKQHCPEYDCGAEARQDKKFVIFKEVKK